MRKISTFASLMFWGFVMKGHHVHHYHLNCLMFSIPFLPMLFLLAGVTAETAVRQIVDEEGNCSPA